MDHTEEMTATVQRAFAIVEAIGGVLAGATGCEARTAALRDYRTEHEAEFSALTAQIRRFPLDALKPVIMAEQARFPNAGAAVRLAMQCKDDPAFLAEWTAVSQLLGGP